jgi:hypothetical protein
MKSMFLLPMVALLIFIAAVSSAQNTDFQTGTIVSVETIDSSAPTGGTDAPPAANRQKHNLSITLGGTIYVCRVETSKDYDLGWAQGKEVQVRVKGKTMDVKRENGKVVKLSILSRKTSG